MPFCWFCHEAAHLLQAIVLFVGAKSFKELLSQTFSSLCKDPVVAVRKSLSNGFHEVTLFNIYKVNS